MIKLVSKITNKFSSTKEACHTSWISPPPQIFAGINVQCIAHAACYSQIHDVALSLSSRVDQTLLGQLKRRKGKQEVRLQLDKT